MKTYYRNKINRNFAESLSQKQETNKKVIEVLSQKREINRDIKKLEDQKKDLLMIMLIINIAIVLFSFIGTIGMITSALIEIPKTISIMMPIIISLSGVNTIYRLRKITKCNKEINCKIEQKKYLDKVECELEKLQNNPKIKLKNIKKLNDWKKKMILMKDYAKYKKKFIRSYKVGKLSETLKKSYYTPSEIRFLYDQTEEDVLEMKNNKVLVKQKKR